MDYIEAFGNLRTNQKWGRKSPHKAVLMLAVIEMYETNVLTENAIYYNDSLKSTFRRVWKKALPEESLFHDDAYLPFWYMQSENFWHVVPKKGREEVLTIMQDEHIKPSETKLEDCVNYVELDSDLYFLMTLPSGRSSLKRVLLENYTSLSEKKIDLLSKSVDNSIDHSATALSEYEQILSQNNNEVTGKTTMLESDNQLIKQFQELNEDVQIVLNLQYYSFLKSHRNEREMFKEVCPTVYSLLDNIVNNPIKQGDISPSFSFIYQNFLADLRIALLSEDDSFDLIDKIRDAIDILNGKNDKKDGSTSTPIQGKIDSEEKQVALETNSENLRRNTLVQDSIQDSSDTNENHKGMRWTEEEEEKISRYFKLGKDIAFISEITGRTELAIKSRLAKLGLIIYEYGKNDYNTATTDDVNPLHKDELNFTITNLSGKSFIVDKKGNAVFITDGQLKYINGRLYRLNLKNMYFTIKRMEYNGVEWIKGEKKIVAYFGSPLYREIDASPNYYEDIKDIVDNPIFENCLLKFKGNWYSNTGKEVEDPKILTKVSEKVKEEVKPEDIQLDIRPKSSLYDSRKQAIIRAMSFFRRPASIREIAQNISRTAWKSTINKDDVEDILSTMPEVESSLGKYILKK